MPTMYFNVLLCRSEMPNKNTNEPILNRLISNAAMHSSYIYTFLALNSPSLPKTSSSNCRDCDFSIKSEIINRKKKSDNQWNFSRKYLSNQSVCDVKSLPLNGMQRSSEAAEEIIELYFINNRWTHGCCFSSSKLLSSFWHGFFKNDIQSI